MIAIIAAPEREKKAYRLRCVFTVPSGAHGRRLEMAKLDAGRRFIRDMALQGREWRSEYGYQLEGPFPHVETLALPSKSMQQRNVHDLSMVQDLTAPSGSEDWKLTMTFVMPERIVETREEACR